MQNRTCVIHSGSRDAVDAVRGTRGRRQDGLTFSAVIGCVASVDQWFTVPSDDPRPVHILCEFSPANLTDSGVESLAERVAALLARECKGVVRDWTFIKADEFFRLYRSKGSGGLEDERRFLARLVSQVQHRMRECPYLDGTILPGGAIRFCGRYLHPRARWITRWGDLPRGADGVAVRLSSSMGGSSWRSFALAQPNEEEICEETGRPLGVYTFAFEIPAQSVPDGAIYCEVLHATLTGDVFNECTPPLISGEITKGDANLIGWPLRALLRADLERGSGEIFICRGSVVNAGTATWNFLDHSFPLAIGMRLRSLRGDREVEYRTRPDKSVVRPGESARFILEVPATDLRPGSYVGQLDMVVDGRFWFGEIGGSAFQFEVNIPGQVEHRARESTSRRLRGRLTPPTSAKHLHYLFCSRSIDPSSSEGQRVRFMGELASGFVEFQLHDLDEKSESRCVEVLSDKKSEGVLVVVHGNVPEQIAQSISHQSGLPIALDLLPVGTRDSRVVSFAECGLVTRRSVQESFFDPNAEQSVAVHEVWVRDEIHAEVVQNRSPDVTAVCVPQPRLVVPSTSRVRESGFLFVGDCANPSVLRCAEWAARIVQEARQRPGVSLYLDLVADQSRFRGEALAASQVVRVWPSLPALFQSEGLPRAALIPLIAGDEPLIQDFLELSRRGITLITTPLGVAAAGLPKQTEVVVGETTQELIQAVRKIAERPMLSTSSDVLSQPNDETGSADLSQRTFRMLQRRMSTPPVTVVLHAARVRHPAVGELRPSEVLCAQNHPCHQLVVVHGDTVVGPCVSDEINPILVPTDESFDAVFRTALSLNGSADLVFLSSALRVSDPSVLMNLFRASYSAPDIAGCTGLILRSSGRVVSCGYDLVEGGALWPRGIGVERESRALRVRSEVAAVDGAFLYVRRDCIERFQKERRTNQAFRAWQDVSKILGWRLIACPDACATLRSDGARKQLGSQIDRLKERTPPGWDAWFPG